ncbi:BCCT family transporter [Actinokineospora fastidiosa]|uniref:BCCT family transporter n=1 Tax=Actinokineospora fastidiosa TaxID=1816 RepID=UPI001E5CD885|nr:BCCT family transporter [Actinokineospora fastidiosa]
MDLVVPFVGVFISRIFNGRRVPEFVATVLLMPTVVRFLWFSVFGAGLSASCSAVVGVAGVLVVLFFVTSWDSGSLVVDMPASGGDETSLGVEPDLLVVSRRRGRRRLGAGGG